MPARESCPYFFFAPASHGLSEWQMPRNIYKLPLEAPLNAPFRAIA